MTYLNGTLNFYPNHRLFESLRHLLTLTACVGVSTLAVSTRTPTDVPSTIFPSRAFNLDLILPTRGPIELALRDQKPHLITLKLSPSIRLPPAGTGTSSKILFPLLGFVCSIVFVNFYEAHVTWIKSRESFGPEVAKWPPPLNFGRIVRNFISHNGKVYFENRSAAPITWHNFTYSPADQGRIVVGTELQYAEMLILMIEMSDVLDKFGAPMP